MNHETCPECAAYGRNPGSIYATPKTGTGDVRYRCGSCKCLWTRENHNELYHAALVRRAQVDFAATWHMVWDPSR